MNRSILASYAAVDSPGRADSHGAFTPQAVRFADTHRKSGANVSLRPFDNAQSSVRSMVLDHVMTSGPRNAWAYFGHGTRRSLPSMKCTMRDVVALADALTVLAGNNREMVVSLFACSTAESPLRESVAGDGGFADSLRDALSARGLTGWVDAHTTVAHTTINPHVRRFYIERGIGNVGGTWLVAPGSLEFETWRYRIRHDESFRFGFTYMYESDIHHALHETLARKWSGEPAPTKEK